eukprot:CAMPEP_0118934986 /NCGR_PEP_ID=MMETSP1169-20130426/14650_1 /TAXON_ID=36882 /ORGANISM="Pyramimonas obovata, Strain CCMP722" /LENGTH=574 /DNA_ID=CAMNT_0006877957 /DNA_START=33 /DNA_END=1757 /DNA_ORIENTATION=-
MAVLEANGISADVTADGKAPGSGKVSKSQKRREKKKAVKAARKIAPPEEKEERGVDAVESSGEDKSALEGVEIEYVQKLEIEDEDNPIYEDFKNIFQKFAIGGEEQDEDEGEAADGDADDSAENKKEEKSGGKDDSDSDSDNELDEEGKLSKKKKKLLRRMKIAELKRSCEKPEVVEIWDTTANDPELLVFLKAYRNTVPVPRHWCQKRKFLQGKRGIEKPPWQLPDFIEATGIAKMRQAYQEKEDSKKLKQKQRDKMTPKIGKMDIDYQVLHDAFFRFQTKPKMTKVGDMYYEGKEFEASHANIKPGRLSQELKECLGMGSNAPPPWLIYMQRYGPPPSYPNLKIPGLNAPIPEGARFGYEPGEWGKPPVDEQGRPVYGDVFGVHGEKVNPYEENVDKTERWGELQEEEEEESEEEEEDYEDDDETMSHATEEDAYKGGIASISSLTPSGVETPDTLDLRKKTAAEPRPLYQVLEQQEASVGSALMGSSHTYVVPGAKTQKGGDVELTLRPEELEGLDEAAIQAKYDQYQQTEKEQNKQEDFSDMVAEIANKQKRKNQAKEKESKKKYKDFKF